MEKSWLPFFVLLLGWGAGALVGLSGRAVAVSVLSIGIWGIVVYFLWKTVNNKHLKWVGIGVVSLSTVLFVGYFAPKFAGPRMDESKIRLFLQYAYEWDNYLGSENKPNEMSRIVSTPIEAIFDDKEYRLLLGVRNDNQPKLPLTNVRMHVSFFDDDLTVRTETPWRPMMPNKDAFTLISPVINSGSGIHPNGSLWIRFPKPRRYVIGYEINGANFQPISGIFKIHLKSKSSSIDAEILDKLKIVETLPTAVTSTMRQDR